MNFYRRFLGLSAGGTKHQTLNGLRDSSADFMSSGSCADAERMGADAIGTIRAWFPDVGEDRLTGYGTLVVPGLAGGDRIREISEIIRSKGALATHLVVALRDVSEGVSKANWAGTPDKRLFVGGCVRIAAVAAARIIADGTAEPARDIA